MCVCGQNIKYCCFETYCTLPAQQVLEIVDNPELLSQQISALLSDPMVVDEVRQAPVRRAWVLVVSLVNVKPRLVARCYCTSIYAGIVYVSGELYDTL